MAFMDNLPSTSSLTHGPTKTLFYSHHGYGKTYQCRFYAETYGKGLILSGEAGLKSLEDVDIDFLPFSSWDGEHDPAKGKFSFKGIWKMMQTDNFKKAGYKWIAIDSLTEMGERCLEKCEKDNEHTSNGFQVWADYKRSMLGALKAIRDMDMHVYVTCLATEETDANDKTQYWPALPGRGVAKQVPALFDHVMCGVRTTETTDVGIPRVKRWIVTDEVSGWHGKTRDPKNTLKAFEECDNVTELLVRISGEKK